MKSAFPLLLGLLISSLSLTNCQKKDVLPSTDCTREAYIIGFDPCRGTDGKALVIALTAPRDTVLTYNFPEGVYDFPPTIYADPRTSFLFPDSVRRAYKVRLGYRVTPPEELFSGICRANVPLAAFLRAVGNGKRQISITCAQKE